MAADKTRLGATAPGSRARRGEFELRQRQLPADRKARNASGKSWERARQELDKTPLGAPQKPYDVRSVYDSRPINGYDFMIPVTFGGELASTFTASFNVREGYVAVLREVSHFFTDAPQPPGVTRADCLLTLQLNGGTVLDNENVPVGINSEALWKGFIVANEFDTLTALLALQNGLTATNGIVVFYGNYILKTGTVPPFEIANPRQNVSHPRTVMPTSRRTPIAPTPPTPPAPPAPPAPPSPSAPTPTTQRGPFVAHGAKNRR